MALHPWWSNTGDEVLNPEELTPDLARDLASLVARGEIPGVSLLGYRQSPNMQFAAIALEIETERPQDLAYPIHAVEPVAIAFAFDGGPPSVLSLREDFPDTQHQNWSPEGAPCSLCIDDRPWAEARLTATAQDILRRAQLWLAKAARGELHDQAQPLDPLFFKSPAGIVLPPAAIQASTGEPIELSGRIRPDNPNLILSSVADPTDVNGPVLCVLTFHAQPQAMGGLRRAPRTLSALAAELQKCGIDLIGELSSRLRTWSGPGNARAQRLMSRLAFVVAFPVVEGTGRSVNDFRAFLTFDTAGEIGVALGVLLANKQVRNAPPYVQNIQKTTANDNSIRIEPAEIYFSLNRELAAMFAGKPAANNMRAVMVGCGSIGSQFALNLAREGYCSWTVIDNDFILPHNLVRHALFETDVGAPKAAALAFHLSGLLAERAVAIEANVLSPHPDQVLALESAFAEANIIIDASASVAASRYLSDVAVGARRISIFFNPAGNAVVLLAENADRSITLRDLEAQYYRAILTSPRLAGHLTGGESSRYSGSCRTLTNRIPASNAAVLSALASKGTMAALERDTSSITVWKFSEDSEISRFELAGEPVTRFSSGDWTISYDHELARRLAAMREQHLPNETGGVLLGIADMSRKSIQLAYGMDPPADSVSSPAKFERGIVNVAGQIEEAAKVTMHQVRYLGEWHSHPDRTTSLPSSTDMEQLFWLTDELENEGLPGLVAIVGEQGQISISFCRSDKAMNDD